MINNKVKKEIVFLKFLIQKNSKKVRMIFSNIDRVNIKDKSLLEFKW